MAEQIRARLAEVMEAHWGALHPLLDPRSGRIPAALTESAEAPFPPVNPDRVRYSWPVIGRLITRGIAEGMTSGLSREERRRLERG